MKKLVIIPAYNEQGGIEKTVQDVLQYAPDFDYVIINDCSVDDTLEVCRKNNFHVINLPVNLGIGGSVQTGYVYAWRNGYDIAVQFDGDGQHNAAYLNVLADKLIKENLDMVIGSRYIKKEGFQSSLLRRMGIWFLSWLVFCCTGKRVYDVTSGFRAVNRKYIEIFSKEYAQDYPEPEAIVAVSKHHGRIREVPVIMKERKNGESSISTVKSVYYMVKVSLAIIFQKISG